jgi:hypothetical protein
MEAMQQLEHQQQYLDRHVLEVVQVLAISPAHRQLEHLQMAAAEETDSLVEMEMVQQVMLAA